MSEITFEEQTLTINDKEIELSENIEMVSEKDGTVLALVEKGSMDPKNVIAFDKDGNEKWRIEPAKKDKDDNPHRFHEMFVRDEYVLLRDFDMHRYKVDLDTGEIEHLGWSR